MKKLLSKVLGWEVVQFDSRTTSFAFWKISSLFTNIKTNDHYIFFQKLIYSNNF